MTELQRCLSQIGNDRLRKDIFYCVQEMERSARTKGYRQGYLTGYSEGYQDCKNGKDPLQNVPDLPLEYLELSTRAINCLHGAQCYRLPEVAALPLETIQQMRNLGKQTAYEITAALHKQNIFHTAWDHYHL